MANFLLAGTGQTDRRAEEKDRFDLQAGFDRRRRLQDDHRHDGQDDPRPRHERHRLIEGSDPKLKDEYFVVGAHYDHLGAWDDYVWNGADDNGSGSVGVLNIAKAIAANPVKPKRSIVFALWTGEEEGLLGSRYYVNNPEFPIDKTVGYLNYDMISRPYDAETLARTMRTYSVPGRRGNRQEGPGPLVRHRQPDRGHALRRHRPGDEPVRRPRPGLPAQSPRRGQRRLRPCLVRQRSSSRSSITWPP